MLTEFQEKKVKALFRFWDLDRDGRISSGDYDQVIRNYLEWATPEEGSPEHREIVDRYQGFWGQMQRFDADGDGVVSEAEYVAAIDAWMSDKQAFEAAMEANVEAYCQLNDRDKDGKISLEEFELTYRAHNLDASAANAAFGKLDRNGDGFISKDELSESIVEMYYSEDPNAPGNWIALPQGPE